MKTKRFRKWCAIFIPTLVIIFFFAGFLFAPNDPMKSNLLERYADPSAEYPFGTDALGRCILSRILYGGWTTLGIVLGGSLIVFLLGTPNKALLAKRILLCSLFAGKETG